MKKLILITLLLVGCHAVTEPDYTVELKIVTCPGWPIVIIETGNSEGPNEVIVYDLPGDWVTTYRFELTENSTHLYYLIQGGIELYINDSLVFNSNTYEITFGSIDVRRYFQP